MIEMLKILGFLLSAEAARNITNVTFLVLAAAARNVGNATFLVSGPGKHI